ncbi:hypothetical protein O7543_16390 [Solwaraspora sp. WMMA2080]|uniref:hypothetical protein n=1 Tax=unclassified Solwaraspora TaxID=2627926 RepID=UPI00248CF594|nr:MULTISPECIES: hypothetical protein [unclassified Solwaraspora]WBB97591.1 hypothetical protein O7553_00940 [Solwaraspora sp. WMMA2059]WBC18516.1 hypothetical protein O7543_16390 [Solwaraspora sp. WMMA2080]
MIDASALAPATPAARAAMSAVGGLLRLSGLAGYAARRLARATTTAVRSYRPLAVNHRLEGALQQLRVDHLI